MADADLNARLFEVNMYNGFINLAKLLITLTTDVTRWIEQIENENTPFLHLNHLQLGSNLIVFPHMQITV